MNRFLTMRWSDRAWHPSDEDLLLHIDGELDPRESSRMGRHLQSCWTCRARADELQETITSFIQYLDSSFTPELQPPPRGWHTFPTRLRRSSLSVRDRSTLAQFLGSAINLAWRRRPAGALAVALVIVLTTLLVRFEHVEPVSANQLLQRAAEAKARRINQTSEPVVYQKLEVRRTTPLSPAEGHLIWEIWSEP
ncbi:MAG: anti-sigma factor family protein, partial [Pyrinomonadaceae bacterium]